MTYLKEVLSRRINLPEAKEIAKKANEDTIFRNELLKLFRDKDDRISYQALWCLTHTGNEGKKWLTNIQDKLIDEALTTNHSGKRRLLLTLLYEQTLANPPRVDFLDFCLEKMLSGSESTAVQSLSIKLAHKMCQQIPELMQEFTSCLDLIDIHTASPAIVSAKRIVNKASKM